MAVVRRPGAALLALLGALLLPPAPRASAWQSPPRSMLLVVTGIGGQTEYSDRYYGWGSELVDAAHARYGLADADVVWLAERPERDATRIDGRSTLAQMQGALAGLAERSRPGDRLLVVLIGHGSEGEDGPRLNLPGPDLSPGALATMLEPLRGRSVAVVVTSAASAGFLEPLAAPGRLVVTATGAAGERNETLFPGFFVDAYAGEGGDTDRDGSVSLEEAFAYAQAEVARAYEKENLLRTEHARMEGDGAAFALGAASPSAAASASASVSTLSPDASPALRALHERRRALVASIDSLKSVRGSLPAERYDNELERLLVELAKTDRAIRDAGGGRP